MNSGSTVRMLLGACAGAGVRARFDGDDSLRRRPMEPVAAQLRAFGAKIETAEGHLPLELSGTPEVETRHFILLTPSAQVKSALLFAGLFAGSRSQSTATAARAITPNGCCATSAPISSGRNAPCGSPAGRSYEAVEDRGRLFRCGLLHHRCDGTRRAARSSSATSASIRRASGCSTPCGRWERRSSCGTREPCAGSRSQTWRSSTGPLRATSIGPDVALRAIDEIPLVAIAAAFASGTTTIAGVGELRIEGVGPDRGIERLLAAVGSRRVYERGVLRIVGGRRRARHSSRDSRRSSDRDGGAVLGCAAGPLAIDSDESLDVSFPGFLASLEALRPA